MEWEARSHASRQVLLVCILSVVAAQSADAALSAGAARIDVTPDADAAIPMAGYAGRAEGHKGIFDKLYVRAVVMEDGTARAAVVTADLAGVPEWLWSETTARISSETGIPRENILLAATHTHAGPSLARTSEERNAKVASYTRVVQARMIEAVRQALARRKPARMGSGKGKAAVSVNRTALMVDSLFWLGRNPDGPTDTTLAVVKLESLAGETIALLMNHGVHATVLGPKNLMISGDLAGAASRHVESHYGGAAVALWTSGAAGDQAPIYNRAEKPDEAVVLGRIMGDEAIRVAKTLRFTSTTGLRGAQQVVTCPGKKSPPGQAGRTAPFADAEPISIRLSVLMLGNIALAGVSGEVLTMIGQRLKKESPFSETIMITNCNGYSGYMPDDAAYTKVGYEIVTTRLKPGCAETAILNGFLGLMDQ